MNNIDEYSSYSEQNEINQNILNDYSNSVLSEEDDINKYDENSFINEINNYSNNKTNYNFEVKKKYNTIDYLNFNEDESKKQQCYRKQLATIVPIVTYKILKKNNIKTISLKDLKTKLNFKCKTYFKNEKLFSELNPNTEHKILNLKYNNKNTININHKNKNYSELVLNSLIKYIKKIKDKIYLNINVIKPKNKKISNKKELIEQKISNNDNCLKQCKSFIYNFNNKEESTSETNITYPTINIKEDDGGKIHYENSFNNFFENKIDNDNLALGLLKYFIDENNVISLSYQKLKDILNCNIYRIKKSILYIKQYFNNYINNID